MIITAFGNSLPKETFVELCELLSRLPMLGGVSFNSMVFDKDTLQAILNMVSISKSIEIINRAEDASYLDYTVYLYLNVRGSNNYSVGTQHCEPPPIIGGQSSSWTRSSVPGNYLVGITWVAILPKGILQQKSS